MTHLLRIAFATCFISTLVYSQQKYLYLENTITHKTKRFNLDQASYLYMAIDSTNDFNTGGKNYLTYNPADCQFGIKEVTFKFSEYDEYHEWTVDDTYYYNENFIELITDSSVIISYTNPASDINIYLTHQNKFRRAIMSFGIGVFCAAIVNAVIISPVIGMNNGSFTGYDWNRFARYELYSGIGIIAGFTLGASFSDRRYYFQTQSGNYATWKVVDSK